MTDLKRLNIAGLLLLSWMYISCSQIKSETAQPARPPYIKTLHDSLVLKLKQTNIPGAAVAVVKDSSIIYLQAFGLRESGTTDSVNIHSVFRLASLSKGFSAVLTGSLVEDGLLGWEDKVIDHYPAFTLKDTAQTRRIEIRHLLSHTAGLQRHAFTNLIEDGHPLDYVINRLREIEIINKEGTVYSYQNAAFAVIEKIVLEATDSSFSELMQSRIFNPAKMGDASLTYEGLINNKNIALPHRWNGRDAYKPIPLTQKYYNAVSAGGINASIADMAQWLQVVLGNRPEIISSASLDYIFNPVVKVKTSRYSRRWGKRDSQYALGWRVLQIDNHTFIFHGGYVNGYRSEIAIDRQNKIGICLLLNGAHSMAGSIIPDFFRSIQDQK